MRTAVHHERAVGAVRRFGGVDEVEQLVARVRRWKRARHTGCDVAEVAERPRRVSHRRVAQEAFWLVDAIARYERRAFLQRERDADFFCQPLVDVDNGIVQQNRRRRRHRIQLHSRELQVGEHRRVAGDARRRFRDPARLWARRRKWAIVDGARDLPHTRNAADRRDGLQRAVDRGFCFRRHQITAIRAGANGQRFFFDSHQARRIALADVSVEGRFVLQRRTRQRSARERHALRFDRQGINSPVDTGDFLFAQHVRSAALFNFSEALIIALLEIFERAIEVLQGADGLVIRSLGLKPSEFGHVSCPV